MAPPDRARHRARPGGRATARAGSARRCVAGAGCATWLGHAGLLAGRRSSSSWLPCACFLVLAVSPRLFDQGVQWFTLTLPAAALSGGDGGRPRQLDLGVLRGRRPRARCRVPDRLAAAARRSRPAAGRGGMWLVLLLPSWLPSLGWVRLVQVDGVMYRVGLDCPSSPTRSWARSGSCCCSGCAASLLVPRPHRGARRPRPGVRGRRPDPRGEPPAGDPAVTPILAPAIWSALAIGFAESVSDFGVAATLAYKSNFTLATYQLYAAINNFPPSFPRRRDGLAARGLGGAAARAAGAGAARPELRGASGRTRQVVRRGCRGRAACWRRPGRALLRRRARRPRLRRCQRLAAGRLRRLVQAHVRQLPPVFHKPTCSGRSSARSSTARSSPRSRSSPASWPRGC